MPTRRSTGKRTTRGKTTRSRRTTTKRTTTKRKLSPAQKAQRKYASAMRGVRTRAKAARRGKGAVKLRSAARNLRRKLGLKN